MNQAIQVFQTNSRIRWRVFQWTGRILLFIVILIIPIIITTFIIGIKPILPILSSDNGILHHLSNPTVPVGLSNNELRRYKGFNAFFNEKSKYKKKRQDVIQEGKLPIRAAFYVDWDPQSFYSLQQNIDKLNMVIPEWFFIDPSSDTLKPQIDMSALTLMKQHHVKILPLINNINEQKGVGEFDGSILHRILKNSAKKERLINDIARYIKLYQLQGINIDFEEFKEKKDEPIVAFQKELYEHLHREGLIVTQDIVPNDEDYNIKELARYNDYLLLMAYDEHFSSSVPGPVSSQRWIEKVLDETAKEIPSEQIIVCIAGYGYDWADGDEGTTVTYQQALSNARQYNADIHFDNDTYNNDYSYEEPDGTEHKVYFVDAAANFNVIRFADEYGTAGTSLWRLGSEDERLWRFYDRSLTNANMQQHPFDYSQLKDVKVSISRPDYIGDGEVLNVVSLPQPGMIRFETDSIENIITEQKYISLPTKYVIQKYGNVHNEVVLTFDDGPDPEYTPMILDILKKENVPASFFIVGLEGENNLPLLKRIYREGHEIGNHTFTHPNIANVSSERAAAEMESTRLLIEAATGSSTVLFRAPYNADAEPSTYAELRPVGLSKEKNYYTVGESIDPNDWEPGVTADSIYQRTIHQYEANPEKGIILLHDAGGNREATVEALPRIIHYFKGKGVKFTTIAKLLHVTKDVVMPRAQNRLIPIDSKIAGLGFWLEQFLSTAFWLAIVLGMSRIILMAAMAIIQKFKSNKYKQPNEMAQTHTPGVSIIVPAYNEELNAVETIHNLLQQDYHNFNIIFVDDGSKDATYQNVLSAFGKHHNVVVLTKPNGGKASALNYGISMSENDYLVCVDADTQLAKDAVTQMMKKMFFPMKQGVVVGAVAGNVKVGNERTLLTKWQSIEYTTAQNFDRRAFDLINGITVVPGAIGAFRKEAIEKAGGFTTDTLAEDCDLTIRILRKGYQVVNCTEAIAVTEAPETITQFMKQRFRWSYGIMQAFWKNRDACFNLKFKGLGMAALPNILFFQIILPLLAPLADLMLIVSLIWNRHNPESMHKIGGYYLVFLMIDITVSVIAFSFENEKFKKLIWLIPQRFIYRQLMYVILYRAIKRVIKGETQGWGVLRRTGNVKQVIPAA